MANVVLPKVRMSIPCLAVDLEPGMPVTIHSPLHTIRMAPGVSEKYLLDGMWFYVVLTDGDGTFKAGCRVVWNGERRPQEERVGTSYLHRRCPAEHARSVHSNDVGAVCSSGVLRVPADCQPCSSGGRGYVTSASFTGVNHGEEKKTSIRCWASCSRRHSSNDFDRLVGLHPRLGNRGMDERPAASRWRRETAGSEEAARFHRSQEACAAQVARSTLGHNVASIPAINGGYLEKKHQACQVRRRAA